MNRIQIAFILLLLATALSGMAQVGSLTGTLTTPAGEPIPFAGVWLDQTKGTMTDEGGNFRLEKVPAGTYTLRVSSLGYQALSREVRIDAGQTLSLSLSLNERAEQLNPVVISATRSERSLGELPIPVTVISGDQIRSMGSLRLNEVLAEQTGLALVSDHGTGIQVQGFNPEYTLILIDGEPLIGRTSGTLELNRITVGNIRQIEIVKGPSSSLYGSEALAGVINIITENPDGTRGNITGRYGSNNTLDLSSSLNYRHKKFGLYAFLNRYSTDGYDLSPETPGNTVSPFQNYTANAKLNYDFSNRTKLSISGRYFTEDQQSISPLATDAGTSLLNGRGAVNDWNLNPVLTQTFSGKLKTTFRFYGSGYRTRSELRHQPDGAMFDESYFHQTFFRPEIQTEYFLNARNTFTLGLGRIWESVEATRYEDRVHFQTNYAYFQYEWQPIRPLKLIAGGRFDDHSAYQSQFSPKLSAQYEVKPWVTLRGSAGVGFKAPDFRQLYLNFINTSVGYSVFGSQQLAAGIARLQAQGQIADLLIDPTSFGDIRAESSRAYNLGIRLQPAKGLTLNANFFRNNITDLIETRPVARTTNGQQVFSYYNIRNVFTEGIESDIAYAPLPGLNVSLGHQLLIAKDQDVVAQLERGEVFARDPQTGQTRRVSPNQYGGLFNRSRHMLNAKVFYEGPKGISANVRAIYRSRFGFADQNNNTILDADSEYAPGYLTLHLSVAKNVSEWLRLQAGGDNLLNHTAPMTLPTLPGRLLWLSAGVSLGKKREE